MRASLVESPNGTLVGHSSPDCRWVVYCFEEELILYRVTHQECGLAEGGGTAV